MTGGTFATVCRALSHAVHPIFILTVSHITPSEMSDDIAHQQRCLCMLACGRLTPGELRNDVELNAVDPDRGCVNGVALLHQLQFLDVGVGQPPQPNLWCCGMPCAK